MVTSSALVFNRAVMECEPNMNYAYNLKRISGPAVEPVTLTEVKQEARLTSTADDSLLTGLISTAREVAEDMTHRSLALKTYQVYLDHFPPPTEPIRVPAPPLVTLSSIEYLDSTLTWQTWDAAEYFVASVQEPALILYKPGSIYPVAQCVPWPVRVNFTAGFDAANPNAEPKIPSKFKKGLIRLVIHFYEHPEAISTENYKAIPLGIRTLLTPLYLL